MYFTPDWQAAKKSVRKLAALEPELAVTSHASRCKDRRCGTRSIVLRATLTRSPCRSTGATQPNLPAPKTASAGHNLID
jgi:hypothetical protein